MSIRFATDEEIADWDAKVLANPDRGNVFQGAEFAEQKKKTGWKPRYILTEKVAITVLEKRVSGLGNLWYLPKGPGVASPVQIRDMLPELQSLARMNGVFAVKLEPELSKEADAEKLFRELGLNKVQPVQPNSSTVLIDLTPELDTIMSNLNQKGRHAIRRAERDGVILKRADASNENCKLFYHLLTETGVGKGFTVRSYEYQRTFWQKYSDVGLGQLFFAYVDDRLVAGAYAIVFGDKSTYKDGASVREKTVYGASHLLQWEVIKWAKEHGSIIHDLCGTPPSDKINDENHPHYGIGRFKTSFNKQVTDYVGAYDLVVKPRQYALWIRFAERLTKRVWWRKYHENWY